MLKINGIVESCTNYMAYSTISALHYTILHYYYILRRYQMVIEIIIITHVLPPFDFELPSI